MIDYAKLGVLAGIFMAGLFLGWYYEHGNLVAYQHKVAQIAQIQQAKVESIESQHKLVTKGISDEYDAKLALLRSYYANGVRQSSSSTMPSFSPASSLADANSAYSNLIGQCAETTQQLVSLQEWLNAQIGIK